MLFQRIENLDPLAQFHEQSGAIFVARKVEGAQQVKIAALIGAGALHDEVPGTAHFFEHLPFNATANFRDGEIFKFFQDNGGSLNAFTSHDATVYHGEVQRDKFRDGIRGIAELVCNPIFEDKRIEDEAKTIITEWAMRQGSQGPQRYAKMLRATLGNYNPHEVIGTPLSIQSITQKDIVAFYQRHYTSDNLVVYMQGDLDPLQLLEAGIRSFSLPRGRRTAMPNYSFAASTIQASIPDAAATHATILFPGLLLGAEPKVNQAARISGLMLASIEGGMLREARFDKRLVYGMGINGDHNSAWAFDGIEFDAFPDKVPEVCEIIMRHTSLMAANPDEALFESIRNNRIVGIGEFIKNNREQEPKEEVQMIRKTGIVYPRDAYLNALPSLKVEDIADYAKAHLVQAPVSVVYEGKIDSNFPSHDMLADMRPDYTVPARTSASDKRVTNAIASDPKGIENI